MSATSSSAAAGPLTGQQAGDARSGLCCQLMCMYCSAVCADWRSLFDHVIDCPVRRASGSTPASRPVSSGSCTLSDIVFFSDATVSGSSVSGRSSGEVESGNGRRLPVGSGQHRCVCGLSYTLSHNLERHQRAKGCLKPAKGLPVSTSAVTATQKEMSSASGSKSPFICPYAECGKEIIYERNYHFHLQYHEERLLKLSLPRSQLRTGNAPSVITEAANDINLKSDTGSVTSHGTDAPDVQMEIELS